VHNPAASDVSLSSISGPSILVVDDEPLITFSITEILKSEGFKVSSAVNGMAGVETARAVRPDIVLSDVMMPKMNGIEAAKRIKEFLPDCRIILLSGQAATGELIRLARDEGYDFEVLTKPIRPDALLAVLRREPSGPKG
jgi:CheY-like chemotaxis protein